MAVREQDKIAFGAEGGDLNLTNTPT